MCILALDLIAPPGELLRPVSAHREALRTAKAVH
jgi:hypothetical protein